jgi:uncharacterized protein
VKKIIVTIITAAILIFGVIVLYDFFDSSLPRNHGVVNVKLFLGKSQNQPLVVGFGGSEGGNVMASDALKETRDLFLQHGYAFLAIGYFGLENTPDALDRISLDAIYDSIISASNHPAIDKDKIILYGGSRGAELILNLASRYKDIDAVVTLVPPNVTLPTKFGWGEKSSWTFHNEDVPYITGSAESIQLISQGDFYKGFSEMLKDEQAVSVAEIAVEKINGPILILSAKGDEVWPSELMGNRIVERLKRNNFGHHYTHISVAGGHAASAKHSDVVFEFLENYVIGNETP